MTLQTVKLSDLKPPAANPRRAIGSIDGLADSIAHDGLLQNLVVKPGRGRTFRIVSGERRFRALQALRERGQIDDDFELTVEVRKGLTKDDALRIATVENLQRENLPPLDEAKALAKLIKDGQRLDEIAAQTGLSPATIRRRVALNMLCREAQGALREGAISLAQAEALTLGDDDRQRDVLEDIGRGYGPYSADDIRDHLLDERPSVAMAMFPVEAYTGTITTDLFAEGESSYFDDAEQFFERQREAVEKLAAEYRHKADWVEVTDSYRIAGWQYEQAGEGERGGVLINLAPSGRVEIREGLAKPQIDEDTRTQTDEHPAAARFRATYSTPVRRYLAWHKSLAVQEVLLAGPRKAKEVAAVASLSNFKAHQALTALAKSPEPGSAFAVLEQQARLAALSLGFALDEGEPFWTQFPPCDCEDEELYAAVKALSDHDLDQLHVLLAALSFGQGWCDTLDTEQSLFNLVAQDLNVDMRNHWRVDRTFLEKRTRDQLLTIAGECGYSDGVGTVGSFKKSELVSALLRHFGNAYAASKPTQAQRKAREWLPEAMAFPAIDPDGVDDEAAAAEAEDGDALAEGFAEAA